MHNTDKPKEKVLSSRTVRAYTYDANSYTLSITFSNGSEYVYKGVTPDIMSQVFDTAGSVGSKFKRLIGNGKFKYEKQ